MVPDRTSFHNACLDAGAVALTLLATVTLRPAKGLTLMQQQGFTLCNSKDA